MHDQDSTESLPPATPMVGRPRGADWRDLQSEGVVWEGQVVIVGADADLAARAIITHRRLAFARGGAVVLDVPRAWLRPAPYLKRDGTVVLSVSTPGASYDEQPESLLIRMREGQPAAGYMVAMLANSGARRLSSDMDKLESTVRGALPPVKDDPWIASRALANELGINQPVFPDEPVSKPAPPVSERLVVPATPPPPTSLAKPAAGWTARPPEGDINASVLNLAANPGLASSNALPGDAKRDLVVRQPAGPVATGADRNWNLPAEIGPATTARPHRRSRWAWALRITGLVGLLALAAGFGAGQIPSPLSGGDPTKLPEIANTKSTVKSTESLDIAARQTAVALGIGGVKAPVNSALISRTDAGVPVIDPSGANGSWLAATEAAPPPAVIKPLPTPTVAPLAQIGTPEATATPSPTATAAAATETPLAVLPATPGATPANSATPQATPVAAEPFQFDVQLATGGATLPEFGLAPSANGNWIVVVVDVTNTSDAAAKLPMASFRLHTGSNDQTVDLDPQSDLAAIVAGISPAWASTDTVSFEPRQTHRLVLLFQIDPAASNLTLQAGDRDAPLAEALAANRSLAELPSLP